jgi:hypothetical protein
MTRDCRVISCAVQPRPLTLALSPKGRGELAGVTKEGCVAGRNSVSNYPKSTGDGPPWIQGIADLSPSPSPCAQSGDEDGTY